jgi:hypothetical protein
LHILPELKRALVNSGGRRLALHCCRLMGGARSALGVENASRGASDQAPATFYLYQGGCTDLALLARMGDQAPITRALGATLMRSPITAALLFLSLNVPARSEVVLAFADAMPMGAVYRWRAEIITNGIGFRAAVQRVKENGGSHALEKCRQDGSLWLPLT